MSGVICPEDRPIVTVERIKSAANIHGAYVQGFGKWCVIQNIDDFEVDGYSLIQTDFIRKMRLDKQDRFYAKLCERIGITKKIRPMVPPSTENLFDYLFAKKAGRVFIVECETGGKWSFSIGYIRKITSTHIFLRHFDSTGKFEGKNRKIRISDVSRIGFDERYIKVFEGYLNQKRK